MKVGLIYFRYFPTFEIPAQMKIERFADLLK